MHGRRDGQHVLFSSLLTVPRLVLASRSPRRSLLLSAAGYAHDVRATGVDEALIDGESPADAVLRLADLKAHAALLGSEEVVIGADTMVVLDGQQLGKPDDAQHARRMLAALSGRTHGVLTGWTVLTSEAERFGVCESWVTFKTLTSREIASYVDETKPFDKAGSYALQGDDGRLVVRVQGSRANVMGLPIREIADALGDLGVERSTPDSRTDDPEHV